MRIGYQTVLKLQDRKSAKAWCEGDRFEYGTRYVAWSRQVRLVGDGSPLGKAR